MFWKTPTLSGYFASHDWTHAVEVLQATTQLSRFEQSADALHVMMGAQQLPNAHWLQSESDELTGQAEVCVPASSPLPDEPVTPTVTVQLASSIGTQSPSSGGCDGVMQARGASDSRKSTPRQGKDPNTLLALLSQSAAPPATPFVAAPAGFVGNTRRSGSFERSLPVA
jgi:hypothetical protein